MPRRSGRPRLRELPHVRERLPRLRGDAHRTPRSSPDIEVARASPGTATSTSSAKACCNALITQGKGLGASAGGGHDLLQSYGAQCMALVAQAGPSGNAPELGPLRGYLQGANIPADLQGSLTARLSSSARSGHASSVAGRRTTRRGARRCRGRPRASRRRRGRALRRAAVESGEAALVDLHPLLPPPPSGWLPLLSGSERSVSSNVTPSRCPRG